MPPSVLGVPVPTLPPQKAGYGSVSSGAAQAGTRGGFWDSLGGALGTNIYDERTINPGLASGYDQYLADLQAFGQGGTAIDAEAAMDRAGDQEAMARGEAAYGRQMGSVDLAEQAALGKVPSVAEMQGRQQLDQSMQQNIGLARSGGGASGMRAALYANAKAGQGAVGDAAMARAQEMATARGQYMQGAQGLSGAAGAMRGQGLQRAGMDIGSRETAERNRIERGQTALSGTGTTLANLTSARSGDLSREAGQTGQQNQQLGSTIGGLVKAGGAAIGSDPRVKQGIFPAGVSPSGMDMKQNFAGAGDAAAAQVAGRQDAGLLLQGAASQIGSLNPMSNPMSGGSPGGGNPFQSSIDTLNNAPLNQSAGAVGRLFSYSDPAAKMAIQPANFAQRITSAIDSKSGLVPAGMTAPWGNAGRTSLGGPASIKTGLEPAQSPLVIAPNEPPTVLGTLGRNPYTMPAGNASPMQTVGGMSMPVTFLGGQDAWDAMSPMAQTDFLAGAATRAEQAKVPDASMDTIRQGVLAKKAARESGEADASARAEQTTQGDLLANKANALYGPGPGKYDPSNPPTDDGTDKAVDTAFNLHDENQAADAKAKAAGEPPKPGEPEKGGLGSALSAFGAKTSSATAPYAASYAPLQLQGYGSLIGPRSDPAAKQGKSEASSPIRDFEEKAKGFTYQYKSPEFEDGTYPEGTRHLGPMADTLRDVKGGIGETLTYEDPQTGLLGVNTGRLGLANAAAVNDLHERIKQLEAKRSGKGKK